MKKEKENKMNLRGGVNGVMLDEDTFQLLKTNMFWRSNGYHRNSRKIQYRTTKENVSSPLEICYKS